MEELEILWLESAESKEPWRISCHVMWQDIFHDSDAYLEYYESFKWPVNRVALLTVEGRLCSMIHLNPYKIRQKETEIELHYIVGVSTRETMRGRGYMGRLLGEAFRFLYGRGEAWTYLMPAAEEIYRPFGFCSVSRAVSRKECFCRKSSGDFVPVGRAIPFQDCSERQRRELELFAGRCLSGRFAIYAVHDENYFWEISREMEACGGELLALESNGEIIGYTEYMHDPEEEFPVEIAETVLEEDRRELGYALIRDYLLQRCGREELRVLFTESAFLPQQPGAVHSCRCQIMARILRFEEAARNLARPQGWGERVCCRITDPALEENNGVWELCFGAEETTVRRTQEPPAVCLEIREFAELFFERQPLYLNELV